MSDAFSATFHEAWKPTSRPLLLPQLFRDLHRLCQERAGEVVTEYTPLVLPEPYMWLTTHFRRYFVDAQGELIPWAARHTEFWQWVNQIQPGISLPAFIAVWPRGGGKSTNLELAGAYCAAHGVRQYGVYVSATQEQADDHVGNIATMLETLGMVRAVGRYGQSKGWRHNRVRTERFTWDAFGLDSARRGAKIEEARPGLIFFDDLDTEGDSERVTLTKERALTRRILPSGARDVAVVGVQNLPNANGIFAQLVDGRAEYLMDRIVSGPFPALTDFVAERATDAAGKAYFQITHGEPTWAGQSRESCQRLLNLIGLRAFRVEGQHDKDALGGDLFKREWFTIVDDWPRDVRCVRCWDFAATEDTPTTDPDFSAGPKVCEKNGQYWIIDMPHFRGTPLTVEARVKQEAEQDGRRVDIWIEQEPGASGVNTIDHYQRTVLKGYPVHGLRSTGSKAERAKPLSSAAEAGNVFLVRGGWNAGFLDEAEEFPNGAHDDRIDGCSAAVMVLSSAKPPTIVLPGGVTRTSTWREDAHG